MKKYIKVILVSLLSIFILLLAGCGEEEKYNKAKNEVLQMVAELDKTNLDYKQYVKEDVKPKTEESYQQKKAYWEARLKEHADKVAIIDAKLKEMESLAVKETKLNNDLIGLRNTVKDKEQSTLGVLKESRSMVDLVEKPSEPLTYDAINPWGKYATWK